MTDLQQIRSRLRVKLIKINLHDSYSKGYHQCLLDIEKDAFKLLYKPVNN